MTLTYTNRSLLMMRVGLFTEALRSIERSNELLESVREKRTVVANHVNASFIKLQLGDARAAKELALSALSLAREIGYPVFEAGALSSLGNAERRLGEFDAAIEHLETSIAMRRPVQELRDYVEDVSDLVVTYIDAQRPQRASEVARELDALAGTSFGAAFWPHYVWWAMACGLRAGGADLEADHAAAEAKSSLTDFASRIADESTREAFLALPVNLTIAKGAQ